MSCLTLENIVCVAALYIGLKLAKPLLNSLKALASSPTNVGELGDWALVTGSTDGIGKAYACALAEQGMNIVLVSRSPVKLEHVASEIETKYKVKTKTVDIDYSSSDEKYIPRLEEDLKDLEIGVLVNNVGMSYQFPDEFLALGNKRMKDMIAINITALNAMTRLVLPGMEKRGKGAIINIGSIASAVPFPMLAVYAATKAYVDKFTYALNQEYGRKGIVIQAVLPGYVVSKLSGLRKASFFAPTPEEFVKSALSRLGIHSRTMGYWTHDLRVVITDLLPAALVENVSYNQMAIIRNMALKKIAKAKLAQKEKIAQFG